MDNQRHRSHARRIGALPALLSGVAVGAHAVCTCPAAVPIAFAYQRAAAVVVAEAVSVAPSSDGSSAVQLEVRRLWKSDLPQRLAISTGGTCPYWFEPRRLYLVFLAKDKSGAWVTSRCAGNLQAETARPALDWLEERGTPTSLR